MFRNSNELRCILWFFFSGRMKAMPFVNKTLAKFYRQILPTYMYAVGLYRMPFNQHHLKQFQYHECKTYRDDTKKRLIKPKIKAKHG